MAEDRKNGAGACGKKLWIAPERRPDPGKKAEACGKNPWICAGAEACARGRAQIGEHEGRMIGKQVQACNRNNITIHIITVIYNRRICEIRSLPQFQAMIGRHPEITLIIADNSTEESILEQNREVASQRSWLRYIECGGNIGLSRAYNRAIATIPQDARYWVMFADDDTWFSLEYLENAHRYLCGIHGSGAYNAHGDAACGASGDAGGDAHGHRAGDAAGRRRIPLQMMCGVVETESGWISPRSEHAKELAFSMFLRRPKPGIYRDLYPINSGFFLAGSALREVGGFDERLFLDQVDFLMMDRLRAHGIRKIGVLPGEIRQSFSGDLRKLISGEQGQSNAGNRQQPAFEDMRTSGSGENRQVAAELCAGANGQTEEARWRIFQKDFRTYCDLTGKSLRYRAWILGRRRLMRCAGKAAACVMKRSR